MTCFGGKLTRVTVVLVLLILTQVSYAGPFRSEHISSVLSMEQGLPSDFVDDLYRDSDGFLWIATSGAGLCRYDGYDVLLYSTATADPLKSNFVRNVVEDGFNRLWIASEGGLDILDLKTLKLVGITSPVFESYCFEFCHYVDVDAAGRVWIDFGGTILNLSFNPDGSLDRLLEFKDDDVPSGNLVFEDLAGDGSVWLGLSGEICRLQVDGESVNVVPALPGFRYREDAYLSDFLLKDNEVWISTNDGLYRYDLNSSQWKQYVNDPNDVRSLSQNFVTSLSLSPDREIIAATLKGINVYNPITDDFERVTSEADEDGRIFLASDFVNCVKSYGDGLYVCTESAGVVRISRKETDIVNRSHRSGDNSSIAPNPVNSLLQMEDGTLWVGNVEGGISISSGEMKEFSHITKETGGLIHNSVSALATDGDGNVWAGTWGGGLEVLEPQSPYRRVPKKLPSIDADGRLVYVGSLAYDSLNNLMWIGSNDGIYYYDCGRDELKSAVPDAVSGCVGACVDGRGRLWMGCQQGLYMFDLRRRDDGEPFPFKYFNFRYKLDSPGSRTLEKINCITETSDGAVWFGSNGNGLYRLQDEGSEDVGFVCYGENEGLAYSCVKSILEDSRGDLWISTANGLFRFSPSDGTFISYTVSDGLDSQQFYWNAGLALSDGRLCFGQTCGLSIITPSERPEILSGARLSITKAEVGGRVFYGPHLDMVRLHERDRGITISFSSLTYGRQGEAVFSYRLRGSGSRWVELPQGSHAVSFASMKGGSYVLEVMMADKSGGSRETVEIPLKVRPYFYHTFLFYALICVLAGLCLLAYQRKRVANLVKQKEILRATVEERTKEILEQQKLLEKKAGELSAQNKVLLRQNEELAGHRILFSPESRVASNEGDEQFKTKALAVVRDNYRNPDMDVSLFCQAMGMSKTLLNRKLQNSFGQSASQLISNYRLSLAAEMLTNNRETGTMNISEIAYEVGFNDPKYFTRCFAKKYGVAPSAYPET